MGLSKIKSRLDRLNNPGGGKSSDFKATFGEHQYEKNHKLD